jgi:uncharacterized glyoxalase superfamily protein PhnB
MKPAPSDWPRCSSAVFYQDAVAATEWLCKAFGFQLRLKVENRDGRSEHSELVYGGGLVMVAQQDAPAPRGWKSSMRSPRSLAVPVRRRSCFSSMMSTGTANMHEPETHDYGKDYWADRSYAALDPEGHVWWVVQRLRDSPAPKV